MIKSNNEKVNLGDVVDEMGEAITQDEGGVSAMGVNVLNTLSSSKDAIITTSYEDDYAVRGYEWTLNGVTDLAAGVKLNFLLDMSLVPEGNAVFAIPPTVKSSDSEVTLNIYEGTDYTGGVAPVPDIWNRNRISPQAKNFVVTANAAGSVLGLNLSQHGAFGAGGGFFGTSSSDEGGSARPLILDRTKKYLLVLENLGGDTRIDYESLLFEIPFG